MAMRRTILLMGVTILLLASSCNLWMDNETDKRPSQFEISFTVTRGGSSTSSTWPAKYQNVGFSYASSYGGYYNNIFCAEDGWVGEIYTLKHIYARLGGSGAGTYTSDDGVTELVYHDSLGTCYSIDPNLSTWIEIEVEHLGNELFYGHFEGVLAYPYGYSGPEYISIEGRIYSYFE